MKMIKALAVATCLPASTYASAAVKATVTGSGQFHRRNTGGHPADNERDTSVVNAIRGVCEDGLDNLTNMTEGGA